MQENNQYTLVGMNDNISKCIIDAQDTSEPIVKQFHYTLPYLEKVSLVALWVPDFLFTMFRYSQIFESQTPGYMGHVVPWVAAHGPLLIILAISLPVFCISAHHILQDKKQQTKKNLENFNEICKKLIEQITQNSCITDNHDQQTSISLTTEQPNNPNEIHNLTEQIKQNLYIIEQIKQNSSITDNHNQQTSISLTVYKITDQDKKIYPQLKGLAKIYIAHSTDSNDSNTVVGYWISSDSDKPDILAQIWNFLGTASYAYWIMYGFGFVITGSLAFLANPWLFIIPLLFPLVAHAVHWLFKQTKHNTLTEQDTILATKNLDIAAFLFNKLNNSTNSTSSDDNINNQTVVKKMTQDMYLGSALTFITSWVSSYIGIQFIAWVCTDFIASLATISAHMAALASFISLPMVSAVIGIVFLAAATLWAIYKVTEHYKQSRDTIQTVKENKNLQSFYQYSIDKNAKQGNTSKTISHAIFDMCYYLMSGILVTRFLLIPKTTLFLPWALSATGFCLPLVIVMISAGLAYGTIKAISNYQERQHKANKAEYVSEKLRSLGNSASA
jgi:hypothetical protein